MLGSFRLPYQVHNPAYTTVVQENVWGRAIQKICSKKLPVSLAADEAIKEISQIFKDWDQ
jgi:multiple sugar transport system substrate-binding protein